ncbi:MAG TPA: histidine--tRNA ligase [Candidatus Limenecus avicola]|uniref:Histidine--tRNA ligase n=1 Tax=Candidatus Limenecus avicola TaxID=2840847 RepID=A0A9D1N276_9CLOT|nr:histidine--tRNA ligase [Candidatus Limenecus avicola]
MQAQKGTKDILPDEVSNWQKMESIAQNVFSKANFKEIRTPIFEATELFARGVGDSTDIVNKEMYTFEKSERSLTLRPENTAGVVRAYIEHGFSRLPQPVKLWYKGPMFRYERPQAGRQRQFHQVGVEMFGTKEPSADAEVINLAVKYLNELGLDNLDIEINSLGCPECRKNYRAAIKEVLKPYLKDLCEDCNFRYEKNPLRILDCKVDSCKAIFEKEEIQKVILGDFICDECKEHFEKVKEYLTALQIPYTVNKLLVRGLDYYNRTVFEIKSNNLGSQNAVCGGGRYDSLVETLGGVQTPAVGWAMGMERLNSLISKPENERLDVFVVAENMKETFKIIEELRNAGFSAEFDYANRKFKKQLDKAAKSAKYALILMDDEINSGTVTLKNLDTSEQVNVSRSNYLENIK